MSHAVDPLALVLNTLLGIDILSFAVSETISHLSVIGGAIRPLVTADTSNLIGVEFTFVNCAISPSEEALAVEEPVFELTLVGVAIAELASAVSMVDLADLYSKLFELRKCNDKK